MTATRPASRGLRSLVGPALAALPVFCVLVGLGVWQLDRKAWKEALLQAVAERTTGAPVSVPPVAAWASWDAAADEFRRVRLEGTFLHDKEVAVHGLAEERRGLPLQGFYVFTPLRRDDGSTIVVNRGFVRTEKRDPATRREGQVPGRVAVTGLLRNPEPRPRFVPPNDPAREEWFVRDLAAMAAARGTGPVAPFYVDADGTPNPGGWPRGGQTQVDLPNNHAQYAATWFGIAGTLVAVFGAFAAGRLRRPSGDELQADDAGHDEADAGEPREGGRVAEQRRCRGSPFRPRRSRSRSRRRCRPVGSSAPAPAGRRSPPCRRA